MSEETRKKPAASKRGEVQKREREERQAKALRDNLLRRKQQNRSRGQQSVQDPDDFEALDSSKRDHESS